MNPEETAIATELGNAVKALNNALHKAHAADLEVKVDYQTIEEIGKRHSLRVYYAEISKTAFSQRLG